MLTASSSRAERVQGAWVDEECVRKVVAHWRRQVDGDARTSKACRAPTAAAAVPRWRTTTPTICSPKRWSSSCAPGMGSTSMLQREAARRLRPGRPAHGPPRTQGRGRPVGGFEGASVSDERRRARRNDPERPGNAFFDFLWSELQVGRTPCRDHHRRWAMYDFAVVALLALATLKLVDFLTDAVPQLAKLRSTAHVRDRSRRDRAARLLGVPGVGHRRSQCDRRHVEHGIHRGRPDRAVAGALRVPHARPGNGRRDAWASTEHRSFAPRNQAGDSREGAAQRCAALLVSASG